MHLWNTPRLAEALGREELSGAEKFKYLLLNTAIYAASGYIAWLFVSTSAGWVFWFEGLIVLVISIAGLKRCRERYEGAIHDRFIEDCVVLQTPISIKFFLYFWLAHISVSYSLSWAQLLFSPDTYEEARRFNYLIRSVYNFYPFMLTFVATTLFYIRLGHHMEATARAQQ